MYKYCFFTCYYRNCTLLADCCVLLAVQEFHEKENATAQCISFMYYSGKIG